MKTIEDVAVEMAKSKGTSRDYTFGFLDGVDYARTWKSVRDELPEIPEGKTLSKQVLVRCKNPYDATKEIYMVSMFCRYMNKMGNFWTEGVKPTYWREIE